jgi:hypothetical protein
MDEIEKLYQTGSEAELDVVFFLSTGCVLRRRHDPLKNVSKVLILKQIINPILVLSEVILT